MSWDPAPSSPVTLYAQFTARPGETAAVASLIAGYADTVRAEEANLIFEVYQEESEPERFFVFEIYRDQAGFEHHLATPEGSIFNAALVPLIVEDASELTFLRSTVNR